MAGNLTFEALKAAVEAGEIDTVLVCMADMQGRLIGKRFQAEYFIDSAREEAHGCDYLLANDIDMEPVPGYAAANWDVSCPASRAPLSRPYWGVPSWVRFAAPRASRATTGWHSTRSPLPRS